MRRKFSLIIYFCIFIAAAAAFPCISTCKASAKSVPALTEDEQAYIDSKASGTLRVGFVQDRIPISFSDSRGEFSGLSRYILDDIARISGLSFEYVPLPGGDVTYDYLMEQKLDLVTSVEYNKENQDARGILISDPYLSSRKVVVARKDLDYSYDAALSVAISTGSQTIKKVLHDTYPNYTILDYNTIENCFDAVKSGEADLMILNQYVVEYWLYKPAYEDLKVIPVLGLDDKLCFSAVVPYDEKGNPVGEDGATLISILNKAIAQLDSDRVDSYTIQAIMENRYSFTTYDFLYKYRYTLIVLASAGILILVLLSLLARQRLKFMQEQADAKARNQFLSTMSHEIRTPLNGLIGLNYLMAHRLHDQEQLSRYLDQSTITAKYLLSLVNDMLDMSMLHNEDIKIERKPVDLPLLLSATEAIARSGMMDKQLEFCVDSEVAYPHIIGDDVRIQQILLNLLDNARKFTPEGGIVTVDVQQSALKGNHVCTQIHVSDTGKGVNEEFRKDIFNAFAREQDNVSKGDQGIGLGLSICYRLARLMDGDLQYVSEPGRGSVFTFLFNAPVAELPPEASAASPEPAKERRILIAEDNELNGEIMLELLSENGFQADLTTNGLEALRTFSVSEPGIYDTILMDLLMPEMDGFEAAKAIRSMDREDARTIRIIACSANCTPEDRQKAYASGMNDFLAKPVDVSLLLDMLKN